MPHVVNVTTCHKKIPDKLGFHKTVWWRKMRWADLTISKGNPKEIITRNVIFSFESQTLRVVGFLNDSQKLKIKIPDIWENIELKCFIRLHVNFFLKKKWTRVNTFQHQEAITNIHHCVVLEENWLFRSLTTLKFTIMVCNALVLNWNFYF